MPVQNQRNRRAFMRTLSGLTAAAWGTGATGGSLLFVPAEARADTAEQRANAAFALRRAVAIADHNVPSPLHIANGDELRYPNRIGNFSKGLPHNSLGEVDAAAYMSLVNALTSGRPEDFESIALGGTLRLVNPQAGLAFDLEGLDSHQFVQPPAPRLDSAQRAGEAVECYWMALLRDVNFSDYVTNSDALAAADELSQLADFRGPKVGGSVTGNTLFRGFTTGDLVGPYVSQFLLLPFDYGALSVEQRFNTYLPASSGGADYLRDAASWLAAQNGVPPTEQNRVDPIPRFVRCGRDLAAWVHVDVLFQAYFDASLWLIDNQAPLNPGNPYNNSRTQAGFGTFGPPHFASLLAEVATRALKAVWYEKWFVHRALRPEEFGGLTHFTVSKIANYPLHSDVLNSNALENTYSRTGSYLLPQTFPEGCPQHPSYGAGHATVAGACVTILKALFDENHIIENPVVASTDGQSLLPYAGADAANITVGGELNKLAANIGVGRNHAGVHWRSDYEASLLLGEAVAISVLRDQKGCYNERLVGSSFTRFDGTSIVV